MWFHLHDVQKQAKLIYDKEEWWLPLGCLIWAGGGSRCCSCAHVKFIELHALRFMHLSIYKLYIDINEKIHNLIYVR